MFKFLEKNSAAKFYCKTNYSEEGENVNDLLLQFSVQCFGKFDGFMFRVKQNVYLRENVKQSAPNERQYLTWLLIIF